MTPAHGREFRRLIDVWLDDRNQSRGGVPTTVIQSGFGELDALIAGFRRGDLAVVSGHPSVGKSALLRSIALTAATNNGLTVGFVSLDLSFEAFALQAVAAESRVDSMRIRQGELSPSEEARISSALHTLSESRFFLNAHVPNTALEIRGWCDKVVTNGPLDLVVVDYLQLIHTPARDDQWRATAQSLKVLAREVDVSVLVASNLTEPFDPTARPIEYRRDLPHGLAETADAVFVLERVWHEESELEDGYRTYGTPLLTTLDIQKNRHSHLGRVTLLFRPEVGAFQGLIERVA